MREVFFSAVRSVIEAMARRNPLVLVFEDIHWADHGMLDLIEYLAQWVRGPLILLCLARDELLERAPAVGRRAPRRDLDPARPADRRADARAGRRRCSAAATATSGAVAAVAERAGGNPFFAEEMARRLADEAGGELFELPDTVQGLLAARLDSLEPRERMLVQHAAVVGRTFWEGVARDRRPERRPRRARRCRASRRRTSSCPTSACGWRASASTRSSTC